MKQLFALMLLAGSFAASAQTPSEPVLIKLYCGPSTSKTLASPLLLVNNQQTTAEALIIDLNKIVQVNVAKPQEASEKHGSKSENGVIALTLESSAPLSRLSDIYTHFSIPLAQQKFKVSVNNKWISEPELLLADMSEVEKVEVVTKQNIFTNSEDKYLNIVTKAR